MHVNAVRKLVVMGHRAHLARVLTNLLDNAQRHANSLITVQVSLNGGHDGVRSAPGSALISVTVTDDGPSIPATDRERIFDRFVRLDDTRTREFGGTGLGLAIARDVARAHGGNLVVIDAAPGLQRQSGATFDLTLPLVIPDVDDQP